MIEHILFVSKLTIGHKLCSLQRSSFSSYTMYFVLKVCFILHRSYIIRRQIDPLSLISFIKNRRVEYIYVCKLNQTVLELDFRDVKFVFFPRRDLNPHH
jgi:hypothetical protein